MTNIDAQKKQLRAHYRGLRKQLDSIQKNRWDAAIWERITGHPLYQRCTTLLTYVSMEGEVDTLALMERAWADGKGVAVPYSVPGTRIIEFYEISSLKELHPGSYGVREPDPAGIKLSGFADSFCVVPGLAYDRRGYRLGYGGGYYDRFLAGPYRSHPTLGVCYQAFLCDELTVDGYDRPCRYLATETGVAELV